MINKHAFDLEERTTKFGQDVIRCCSGVGRHPSHDSIIRQVVSSSGSVGANYREANEALGAKDFVMRLRISRKEAKETIHWLQLLTTAMPHKQKEIDLLIKEAIEIKNILSSIIIKAKQNYREKLGDMWVR